MLQALAVRHEYFGICDTHAVRYHRVSTELVGMTNGPHNGASRTISNDEAPLFDLNHARK
jgi:hypothetical protein